MKILKEVKEFLIYSGEPITVALEKIDRNSKGILFIVDEHGCLVGVLTDGDVRRWMIKNDSPDLSSEVGLICNDRCKSFLMTEASSVISSNLNKSKAIPLLDHSDRVIAIAFEDIEDYTFGGLVISKESPAFVIAEIGNNHNGCIDRAKKLVDMAVMAGADCCKFQMRNMKELYKNDGLSTDPSSDLGSQYTLDLLERFQLTNEKLIEVFDYCKHKGILPMCTPWDLKSLAVLESYGIKAYKIASADLTNDELLIAVCQTKKPFFCSTGMSTEQEIKHAVGVVKKEGGNCIFLHCNSTYPTPFKDVHLNYLKRLGEIAGGIVGYSGHERGFSVPIAAVSLGAKVIEKHLTLDKSMEGNDHKVSLLPDEFQSMVHMIRQVEESLGASNERQITQGEMMNREVLAKSLVASKDIRKGEIISKDKLLARSPGQGLQPCYLPDLLGKKAKRDMYEGDCFFPSDIDDISASARKFSFTRPFGIPVRYHDFENLSEKSNFDFVEFHLSYQDLELKISDFVKKTDEIGFAVHCPELFEGDHILDLCSDDPVYLSKSIAEFERTISVTRKLNSFFPKQNNPVLVLNAGGFTTGHALSVEEREALYTRLKVVLSDINLNGINLAIQTMPPFPWHFGGQSYHNLFMDPDEIVEFSNAMGTSVCLDISHSQLACKQFGWNLHEFCAKTAPWVSHIHLSDSEGVDGEGLQVGDGEIDFTELASIFSSFLPNIQFLPEIWQGHKNNGEGFWLAFQRLERYGF